MAEQIDRIRLFLFGIFVGGLLEVIGITGLAIIISIVLLVGLFLVEYLIKHSQKGSN